MKNPFKFIVLGVAFGVIALVMLTELISVNNAYAFSDQLEKAETNGAISLPTSLPGSIQTRTGDSPFKCSLPILYPESIRKWCDLIELESEKNGLDPRLIAAVMLQESGGNPTAYSKSGAAGLLQVMPRDGIAASFQCINGPCFAARPSKEELFNPGFNVNFGVKMLAGLVKKKGSVREALRAYGPMDVGYTYADKVLSIYQNYK